MSISDAPTLDDVLDRADLAKALALDCLECTPPRVFGVHGDWGAGKTSILRTVQWALSKSCPDAIKPTEEVATRLERVVLQDADTKSRVVWFEAWRYQNEPAPVVALLHEIRGQLALHVKAMNFAKKQFGIAVEAALTHLEELTKAVLSFNAASIVVPPKGASLVATIRDIGERREKTDYAEKLPADAIRERLEHALQQLLGGAYEQEPRRLIILVDDLDRCEPTAAFRLVEGIKLYLNLPNCVFVMGMDERVVQEAVAATMPQGLSAAERMYRAHEYLEKIFQEIRRLPRARSMEPLLDAFLPSGEPTQRPWGTVRECLRQFPELVPGIPRRAKLFCQTLERLIRQEQMVWERADKPEVPAAADVMRDTLTSLAVILAYIYQFHPDVYRMLESNPEAYAGLRQWCRGFATSIPVLQDVQLPLRDPLLARPTSPGPNPAASVGSDQPPGPPTLASTFPDYSRGNVFRAQRLVAQAGDYPPSTIQSLLI